LDRFPINHSVTSGPSWASLKTAASASQSGGVGLDEAAVGAAEELATGLVIGLGAVCRVAAGDEDAVAVGTSVAVGDARTRAGRGSVWRPG